MAFDDRRVLDSDGVLSLAEVPATMVVVGASVIGIEHASIFAALGTRVTVVDKRAVMLEFCDPDLVDSLTLHLRDLGVSFRLGEEVSKVETREHGTVTTLASGKRIAADTVMYSAGRQGQTERLGLERVGIEATAMAGSPSTSTSGRRRDTSTPWGMSSGSRRWPRRA